jgi:hypothetical protein
MAKKNDEAEVKKECPSCGLGVALDATICEFCGWDFEEEDEWILQIEKLERDLMLEKQKFEPGSVNEKIQATLHSPAEAMKGIKSAEKASPKAESRPAPEPVRQVSVQKTAPKPAPQPEHVRAETKIQPKAVVREEAPSSKVRRVRTVRIASKTSVEGGLVSRKQEEGASETDAPSTGGKKVRIVRKVK